MNLKLVVCAEQITDIELSGLKVVDLRSAEAFAQVHLPGAVHLDVAMLNKVQKPVGGLLPDAEHVNLMAKSIGLNSGDHILAYDQGAGTAAARLIWVMHAYGFNSISWLDGGFNAWERAGRETSTAIESVQPSEINLSFTPGNVLSIDELTAQLKASDLRLLDVRTTNEFNGSDVRSARGGHVPNAKHSEWTTVFDENGMLKSDDELHRLFSSLDVNDDNHVVVYCQTHQRSALTYVVLKHLQYDRVSAIDGAWSAWGNSADAPIES